MEKNRLHVKLLFFEYFNVFFFSGSNWDKIMHRMFILADRYAWEVINAFADFAKTLLLAICWRQFEWELLTFHDHQSVQFHTCFGDFD